MGPGGSGKSRLALELGRASAAGSLAAVRFVPLAGLPAGGSVTRLIADVLDVRERRAEPLLAGILARLRSQRTLLILDNCEHVLPTLAGLCVELLAGAPGLRILATSREPLALPVEVTWAVGGLDLPPADGPTSEVLAADSMQLLVERGRAARPGFVLSGSAVASAAALCRRLDGLPLAIELAAARFQGLSVAEVLERLNGRMDVPTRRADPTPDRHRTMRAAMDWSHDLLAPAEQRTLRRLAVFRGRVDLQTALAVIGDATGDDGAPEDPADDGSEPSRNGSPSSGDATDDTFASLCRLVDQSMLVAEPGADGPTSYHLLETIRQYADERLSEAGERRSARARHAATFAGMSHAARDWGGTDQEIWLGRLDIAHYDLLAALEWCVGEGSDGQGALAMAADLWWYWYVRGHVAEGSLWLRRALAATPADPSTTRAAALRGAAALARSGGDYPEAVRLGEQCLAVCRHLGDRQGIAGSLNSLSATNLAMGRVEEAVRYGELSLAEVRGSGNRRGEAASLTNLGMAYRNLDRFDMAAQVLTEAAGVFRAIGDLRGERRRSSTARSSSCAGASSARRDCSARKPWHCVCPWATPRDRWTASMSSRTWM